MEIFIISLLLFGDTDNESINSRLKRYLLLSTTMDL